MPRLSKRDLLAGLLDRTRANRLLARTWRGLVVFNYHRIGDPCGSLFDEDLYSADEEAFAAQVRFLTRQFDVVGIGDLPHVQRARRGRHAMITFDDGYRDNYEAAFPILRAYGARAVFFVTTGFLDDGRLAWWDEIAWMVRTSPREGLPAGAWSDRPIPFEAADRRPAIDRLLRIYKSLSGEVTGPFLDSLAEACGTGRCPRESAAGLWMSWDHVREIQAAGLGIGAHTVNHPVLSRLAPDEQLYEIGESKRRIEAETGRPVTALSYPVGQRDSFDDGTRSALREAGIEWAFSYYGGYARGLDDPHDVPRVPVERHTSPEMFRSITGVPQLFA